MEEAAAREGRPFEAAQGGGDTLVVHASRSKVLARVIPFAVVGAICLVGLVVALVMRWSTGFAVLFGVAGAVFLGYAALLRARALSSRPLLVVDDEGIVDAFYPRGRIPWERVERIQRVRALFGAPSVRVVLRNGLAVRVGLGLLDMSPDQVLAAIERRHAAWLARHRTP
jgi:hypothetical protein